MQILSNCACKLCLEVLKSSELCARATKNLSESFNLSSSYQHCHIYHTTHSHLHGQVGVTAVMKVIDHPFVSPQSFQPLNCAFLIAVMTPYRSLEI